MVGEPEHTNPPAHAPALPAATGVAVQAPAAHASVVQPLPSLQSAAARHSTQLFEAVSHRGVAPPHCASATQATHRLVGEPEHTNPPAHAPALPAATDVFAQAPVPSHRSVVQSLESLHSALVKHRATHVPASQRAAGTQSVVVMQPLTPTSMRQLLEQPSPSTRFPSSQPSLAVLVPSPQPGMR